MSSTALPPRFVPTLTDVVHQAEHFSPAQLETSLQHNPALLEDQMVHRVMQRVDLVLERRLREAVAQVILSHTQALGPRLREEIELVVRESVSQAVAQELPLRSP
ncbi:MAG: hypothetical protein WBK51_04250 [Polaromonas sp.]